MYRDGYLNISKDIDESYILFKRACKSGEWEACAYQVDSLVKVNRIGAANKLLNKISSKAPKSDRIQNLLAHLYYSLGRKEETEGIVRKILINDPNNESAKSLLSKISKASS